MITFNLSSLGMMTFGLGIRMPWHFFQDVETRRPKISFRDKVAAKAGVSFEDETIGFESKGINYKDS